MFRQNKKVIKQLFSLGLPIILQCILQSMLPKTLRIPIITGLISVVLLFIAAFALDS